MLRLCNTVDFEVFRPPSEPTKHAFCWGLEFWSTQLVVIYPFSLGSSWQLTLEWLCILPSQTRSRRSSVWTWHLPELMGRLMDQVQSCNRHLQNRKAFVIVDWPPWPCIMAIEACLSVNCLITPKHQHIRFKTSSEHSKLALHPSPAIASHIDHCSLVRLDIKNGKPLEPRAGSRTHLSSVWFASAAPETWQVAVWKRDFATMRAWFLMVFHISSLKDPKVRYCNLACSNCSSAPKSVTACSCHVTMCDWLPLWWSLMFCVSSIRGDFARFCKCI